MSSRVSIGTFDGFSTREVLFDSNTSLDIRVQLDGSNVTPTSSSLYIANGAQVQSISTTNGSGIVTATITTADLHAIGITLWASFKGSWQVTIPDGSGSLTKRFVEVLWIAPEEVCPSLQYSDITNTYSELALSQSIPSGQTSWWYMAELSWRELRNWIDSQTDDRRIWKAENTQAFRQLHLEWTLMKIADYQNSRIQNSKIWADRAEYHRKEVERLKTSTSAWYAQGVVASWGQAPLKNRQTVQAPRFWTGYSSSMDWGKR